PLFTVVRGLNVGACTSACLVSSCDIDIDGLTAWFLTTAVNAVQLLGVTSRLTNFDIQSTAALNAIQFTGTSATVSNGRIQMDGNSSFALYLSAGNGELNADNIRTTGSGSSTTGADITNGTVHLSNVDFASVTTPVNLH